MADVCIYGVMMLTGATVEPFGSFVSNLYSKWGDLDISVELSGSLDSSPAKRKKQTFLKDIQKALRRRGNMVSSMFLYCVLLLPDVQHFLFSIVCVLGCSSSLFFNQVPFAFVLYVSIDPRHIFLSIY